ncbi:MAG: hypothetical protein COU32_03505 [Candidatus Magasanikbacteria bacterium CG10_big_fil_rev_8_21_14_0_10_42_10]|uniref:LTD domain-containing protein n=2 Tax=Candidatus Magasanikiibacteriota TaxID=1752731 RepID=A0A2H0TVM2_9BACT|nr:MAG: hypothetical protein COU32_03505 [Candidatus Magasanikbacteria bacterium CG10_big_fil_rev_8_21_14_0_10_42_10]PIZ94164.1 MAG: hypothetical protein COX82_01245 [Candidatus Magasanikbacteria bacterium CG_4_10_14_0_2_um_filter_41_10]
MRRGNIHKNLFIFFFCIFFNVFLSFPIHAVIDVPFKSQVPPGSWSNTLNCGQTSLEMMFSLLENREPSEDNIKKIDDWLYSTFSDPINSYSGSVTDIKELTKVSQDYKGYNESYYGSGDLEWLKSMLSSGQPVIVGVHINMDVGKKGHFMLALWIEGDEIVVHDPGKTIGAYRSFPLDQFLSSWVLQNNAYVVVKKEKDDSKKEYSASQIFEEGKNLEAPTLFQTITNFVSNFFANIFHSSNNNAQTQQPETLVQENSVQGEDTELSEEPVPIVYGAAFVPSDITMDVFSEQTTALVPVQIQNTGNSKWNPKKISLNVVGGVDKNSRWYADGWVTKLRPAVISSSVKPNQITTVQVPISLVSDLSIPFRLQLVRQNDSQFLPIGTSIATISFHVVEKESRIVDEITSTTSTYTQPNVSPIEKIKEIRKVLGEKIFDTTKKIIDTIAPYIYSGGGSFGGSFSSSSDTTSSNEPAVSLPTLTLDSIIPYSFSVATTSVALFGTKNIVTTGIISSVARSTILFSSSPVWEVLVPLIEGENSVILTPVDDANTYGVSSTLHIIRDTTAPAITSFTSTQDFTTSTDVHLAWSGTEEQSTPIIFNLDMNIDGGEWTSIVTSIEDSSYLFLGERPHTYSFRIQAVDSLGNTSEWRENDGNISLDWPKSVIVNEIAWGGTAASPTYSRDCPKQEWMELKNTTDTDIDLSGWHMLFTSPTGATSSLVLSGSIPSGGYQLLARQDRGQNALAGIPIDTVYQDIDMDNEGMSIILQNDIGRTIDELSFLNGWPAGSIGRSMERMENSWKTSEQVSARGEANGCGGGTIYGSPLQPNDRLWLVRYPFEEYPNLVDDTGKLTLSKDHSPYVLSDEVVIPTGKALIVDSGVELVGRTNNATLIVEGTATFSGTEEHHVRITSSNDASVDIVESGEPSAGDWSHIEVAPGGILNMQYTELSYGGKPFVTSNGFVYGTSQSQVIRSGGDVTLDHVFFTHPFIETNHNYTVYNAIIWFTGGSLAINDSVFDEGNIAIKNAPHTSGSVVVSNSSFQHFVSAEGVIQLDGIFPTLNGNTFTDNTNDTIEISTYEFLQNTTIAAGNNLSFQLLTIPTDVTVDVDAGTTIGLKTSGIFSIYGTLNTHGTSDALVSITNAGGQWGRISFYPGSKGVLLYTNITGGGATVNRESVMLDIGGADVTFDHTNIMYGRWPGTLVRLRGSNTSLLSCTIGFDEIPTGIPTSWSTTAIDVNGGTTSLDDVFIRNVKYGIMGNAGTTVTASHMDGRNFENVRYNKWWPDTMVEFVEEESQTNTSSTPSDA